MVYTIYGYSAILKKKTIIHISKTKEATLKMPEDIHEAGTWLITVLILVTYSVGKEDFKKSVQNMNVVACIIVALCVILPLFF